MKFPILLRLSHLKVTSALLTNCAAGFILSLVGTSDIWLLMSNAFFAMICIILAIHIEDLLI